MAAKDAEEKRTTAYLGYYRCRGLAQPMRYMLEYSRIEYEDWFYNTTTTQNIKNNMPFFREKECHCEPDCDAAYVGDITLPYYISSRGLLICGDKNIINHMALYFNLLSNDPSENSKNLIVEAFADEMRKSWEKLVYDTQFDYEIRKSAYEEKLSTYLAQMTIYLENDVWFSGITQTYVDFVMYELLYINKVIFPNCLQGRADLLDFNFRFESNPVIESYHTSKRYLDLKDCLNTIDACVGTERHLQGEVDPYADSDEDVDADSDEDSDD